MVLCHDSGLGHMVTAAIRAQILYTGICCMPVPISRALSTGQVPWMPVPIFLIFESSLSWDRFTRFWDKEVRILQCIDIFVGKSFHFFIVNFWNRSLFTNPITCVLRLITYWLLLRIIIKKFILNGFPSPIGTPGSPYRAGEAVVCKNQCRLFAFFL